MINIRLIKHKYLDLLFIINYTITLDNHYFMNEQNNLYSFTQTGRNNVLNDIYKPRCTDMLLHI